eukprot:CAMPEP_0113944884 /NCGR_PEP_ID=MMETSP1339-20121228/37528_1 /TAXON_ID=94617 /ORGANISM="Fibrocapsa japonica" /LENGTH=98 /DNA_ID=CAMNT_0000950229 /DNA_START=293 /DNA_END=589 /DNA_ORIENTATION=+ /assembly_acc=CAM_ASM_000762
MRSFSCGGQNSKLCMLASEFDLNSIASVPSTILDLGKTIPYSSLMMAEEIVPDTGLPEWVVKFFGGPAILLVPVLGGIGLASAIAAFIYAISQPEVQD